MKLDYVKDFEKGYFRTRKGGDFIYKNEQGKQISGPKILKRIRSLAIPPAWTDVWISRNENSHILAWGMDDRERKQYIYHEKWKQKKQREKFDRIIDLADHLPAMRKRLRSDLRSETLQKKWVLALAVSVLDATGIRVGNKKYTSDNETYGLTTLRSKHLEDNNHELQFEFIGKSHQEQRYVIDDKRLIRHIRSLDELPGYEVFRYLDADGKSQTISPQEINNYIDEIAEEHFSAKDFRTWVGTTCAVGHILHHIDSKSFPLTHESKADIINAVADELGNTPSVSKEHYIHPSVQKVFESKIIPKIKIDSVPGLSKVEHATLYFLKNRNISS